MKLTAPTLSLALLLLSHAGAQQSLPVPSQDEAGFAPIFDGKSLANWEGDARYWRVENGCLVGEVTPETILKQNTFIVWRGGVTSHFEFKADYRITSHGNSGINYRSTEVPGLPFVMRGYQADIDGEQRNANHLRYTGQNYEERGRTFLALRGQVTRIDPGKKPAIIASLCDAKELESVIHNGDWNEYHLIARGNVLVHILNGRVMAVVLDEDPESRRLDGLLGVQVHVGPPMKVEFRNLRLKKL